MKRRSFLQAGIASSFLPLLTNSSVANALGFKSSTVIQAVVSDSRFADSRSFGAQAAALGMAHYTSQGDITALWFKELDPLWRKHQAAVTGLTTREHLFCLERLAWDRGLRVLARTEHHDNGSGVLTHQIEAPDLLSAQTAKAIATDGQWSAALASLLANCSPPELNGKCTPREFRSRGQLDESLVTWVIAPATARA
ncbi:hypothetical protein [Pseudomonas sp. BN515]|uniref:hypothetical protein n=1 Tax=Pseudomonas sp. BN515 TaxID=2567892 RepID=UPI002455D249|nr:hypothetical protein [Pseudomonas sp. BN515]MDH4874444.1 hypothetical protein [Pseudomonas sp. BN515]